MEGLREASAQCGVPLTVSGFGAAFALHFTERKTLVNYRDTLADNSERLHRFLLEALREGIAIIPDGRMYLSAVHSEEDAQRTVTALTRALDRMSQ
jgi:glutamate-1-semialdehyde 2,1-aminomutase